MRCKGRLQVLLLLRQMVRIATPEMGSVNFIRSYNSLNVTGKGKAVP